MQATPASSSVFRATWGRWPANWLYVNVNMTLGKHGLENTKITVDMFYYHKIFIHTTGKQGRPIYKGVEHITKMSIVLKLLFLKYYVLH